MQKFTENACKVKRNNIRDLDSRYSCGLMILKSKETKRKAQRIDDETRKLIN